jgi:C-terminal processing protease CtpA/Prc
VSSSVVTGFARVDGRPSPAEEAGLQAGDIIVGVNGWCMEKIPFTEICALLTDPVGDLHLVSTLK